MPFNNNKDDKRFAPSARVAVYLRRSREKENGEETLENQRILMERVVEKYGFLDVVWIEEVASGGSIAGRPKFYDLLTRINNGEFKTILVAHLDRLGRSEALDAAIIQNALVAAEAVVITPSQVFDFTDESTLLVTGIESVVAANERRKSIKKMIQAKESGVQVGKLHSGSVPYPYRYTKGIKRIEVVPEWLEVYELMKRLFLEGLSAHEVAKKLNELRIPAPDRRKGGGAKYWYGKTVLAILSNRFHMGYIAYGKNKNGLDYYEQNYTEGIGDQPRTKTEAEHLQILARIEELRKGGKTATKTNRRFRLATLVKCPHCHRVQTVKFERTNSPSSHVGKCVAKSKRRVAACDKTRGIKEDVLFDIVMDEITNKYREIFDIGTAAIDTSKGAAIEKEANVLATNIKVVERRIEKNKELFKADLITIEELKSEVEKENAELNRLRTELERVKNSTVAIESEKKKRRRQTWGANEVIELIQDPSKLDAGQINEILKTIVDYITYEFDDEAEALNVHIEYK